MTYTVQVYVWSWVWLLAPVISEAEAFRSGEVGDTSIYCIRVPGQPELTVRASLKTTTTRRNCMDTQVLATAQKEGFQMLTARLGRFNF